MTSPSQLRSYSAGQFLFHLDGVDASAYVKSVDGGNAKGEVISDQVGPDYTTFKSAATVAYEPISVELGMAASRGIIEWISDSWNRKYSRRSGSILHADFNGKVRTEQWFGEALISETVIPKLDAKDSSPVYMTVKIQPETVETKKGSGTLQGNIGSKQKMWSPSSFRLSLGNLNCDGITSIDSFTIKQKHKTLYTGAHRFPQIEPTGIEFPNLSVTMSAAYAEDFIKWHHDVVVHGKKDTRSEQQGSLFLMDQRGIEDLVEIKLKNVGIFNLKFEKSDAHAEAIKKVKVDLYVEGMDITKGFGLE